METKLVVTIDVEEEQKWGTFKSKGNTTKHLENIDRLQELFEKYKIKPTYLLNYEALQNKKAVAKFKKYLKEEKCEIGAHMHPWANPPYKEKICERNTFACNLPAKLVEAKLKTLTAKIKKTFGVKPLTFKSGRYGFDENQAKILKKLGYKVDTSVVPFWSFKRYQGPSFTEFPYKPYFLKLTKITQEDNKSKLLEIPSTVGFNIRSFELANKLYNTNSKILKILVRVNIIKRIKLTPEYDFSAHDMKQLSMIFLRKKVPVLHMEFHSENIMPGFIGHVSTTEDLEKFYAKLEDVFGYLRNELKVESVTCSEFEKLFSKHQ
jgi:hypothetical protein